MSKKYIYVIDNNGGAVDWLDSLFTIGDVLIVSVQDMVDKVISRLGSNTMRSLFVGGHGSSGYQATGGGASWDSSGNLSLQLDTNGKMKGSNTEHHLGRLRSKFSSDAVVTLGGCQTGSGEAGKALLMELSRIFGVPVEAGTANQRPFVPGMEGSVTRCDARNNSTIVLPSTWWGSPGGGWIN